MIFLFSIDVLKCLIILVTVFPQKTQKPAPAIT